MKSNNYIFILFSVLFLFSCEKEIEFKGDISNPLLVMNSFVMPDEVIKVSLTQSRFFLYDSDKNYKRISDAKVELYVNGEYKEDLSFAKLPYYNEYSPTQVGEEEVYLSNYKPKPGDKLQLKTSTPKFGKVSSEVITMPKTIEVSSIEKSNYRANAVRIDGWYYNDIPIDMSEFGNEDDEENDDDEEHTITYSYRLKEDLDLSFDFQDEAGVNNFYILEIENKKVYKDGTERNMIISYVNDIDVEENYFEDNVFYGAENSFKVNNNIFSQSLDLGLDIFGFEDDYYSYYFMFEDALFNGEKLTLDISLNIFDYSVNLSELVENKLIVRVFHLSREYYLYRKTVNAYHNSSGGLFSEPIQIFNNINGGIGIFAGTTTTEFEIDLPIEEVQIEEIMN